MSPSRSRPTIRDVAREAGVSSSAVSKVLNDGYGVSAEMRDKVTGAVARLGYRPQPGARALRGRSYTVGVLIADIGAPSMAMIVEGIQEHLAASPFECLLTSRGQDPELQRRSIESFLDHQVDGLILIAPSLNARELDELGRTVPLVVVARHGGGAHYDTVVDDDLLGASLMVDHLVELGHRAIVHIADGDRGLKRPSVLPATVRADGYRLAMERHGLEPRTIVTAFTEQGGYDGAMRALRSERPPTAIFAGADIAALGVLRAAHELGLRVPDDLTVTGSDNVVFTAAPQISLTTVDSSAELTGGTSARLLIERINGRDTPVTFSITPRIVVRTSSASPPTSARGVAPESAEVTT